MDYVKITNKDELLDIYKNNIIQIIDSLEGLDNNVIDFVPFYDAWSIKTYN